MKYSDLKFKEGDRVLVSAFDDKDYARTARGVICGLSSMGIVNIWIVKWSEEFPNDTYDFSCSTFPEGVLSIDPNAPVETVGQSRTPELHCNFSDDSGVATSEEDVISFPPKERVVVGYILPIADRKTIREAMESAIEDFGTLGHDMPSITKLNASLALLGKEIK